jgi:ParB-like chromosome segregation protein Spo0J/DNA modification methylase
MIEHKYIDIDLIELLENNPRTIEDSELKALCRDIEADKQYLEQRPSLINFKDGRYICYAGQQRIKAQRLLGYKTAPVFIEHDVPEEAQNKRMVVDNTHRGEWDIKALQENFNFTIEELKDFGLKTTDINFKAIDTLSDMEKQEAKQSLTERFLAPPFSVIDTRQGYWQERKRTWAKIGLNSQETREDIELVAKSGQSSGVYELRNKMREVLGRDPEWDEIIAEAKKQGMHIYEGASIFDPVLCEVLYSWFGIPGGHILDPFAGGSVRGIVASMLGFNYHGIDLRADQVNANYNQAKELCVNNTSPSWEVGDSNIVLDNIKNDYADLVFSCPPYHDLEKYSEDPADLSNMDYQSFFEVYSSIIQKSVEKLKQNRFACFVVSEIRGNKGFYKNFVKDTIEAFEYAGASFYNEIILLNVAGSVPVRVTKQFQGSRKIGRVHQNILVFYKGDPKAIKEEFGDVAVKNIEE